jgi:hypothetical protein
VTAYGRHWARGRAPSDPKRLSLPDEPLRGFDRPLDSFLTALRLAGFNYRMAPVPPPPSHGETFFAGCAACRSGYLTLRIVEVEEDGAISLECDSGCEESAVRNALAHKLAAGGFFGAAVEVAS